jgi:hypothetical protein
MNWKLLFRALWLRGGIVWLVAFRNRVVPRRFPELRNLVALGDQAQLEAPRAQRRQARPADGGADERAES